MSPTQMCQLSELQELLRFLAYIHEGVLTAEGCRRLQSASLDAGLTHRF